MEQIPSLYFTLSNYTKIHVKYPWKVLYKISIMNLPIIWHSVTLALTSFGLTEYYSLKSYNRDTSHMYELFSKSKKNICRMFVE